MDKNVFPVKKKSCIIQFGDVTKNRVPICWTTSPSPLFWTSGSLDWEACECPQQVGGWSNPFEKILRPSLLDHFFQEWKLKKNICHHLVLVSVVFFPDCFGFIGFPCHLFISSCGWFHGDVVCWIFQTFSDKDSMLTKLLNQGTIYHNINSSLGHKLWEQGVLNHIMLITWVGNTTPAILLQNTTFQTKAVNLKDCWQPCNHHAVACSPFYQLLS